MNAAGCEQLFSDEASGGTADRPGLMDALSHCRAGDVLVVQRLDRLGRTVRQLIEFLKELADSNIGFQSLKDNIDTTTAAGRFFFHVIAAFAEMERDLIRERTRSGLEAAKARGRQGGRPSKLTADQIAHVRKLRETESMGSIAKTLGVDPSTLYRALAK